MKKLLICVLLAAACGDNDPGVLDAGVPDAGMPDAGPVGAACVDDIDCASNFCVTELKDGVEVLDGLCTNECSFDDLDSCEDSAVCLVYRPTQEHFCFVACDVDEDCREGWTCPCLNFFCDDKACIPPL